MKVLLSFLVAVVLYCGVHSVPVEIGLKDDFAEISALIPHKKIEALARHFYEHDPEVRAVFEFMRSEDAIAAAKDIAALPEVQELVKFIEDLTKLPVESILEMAFEGPEIIEIRRGGWRAFAHKVGRLIPFKEIKELAKKKIAEGGAFAQLYERLKASQDVYEKILALPSVVAYRQGLRDLGVNVDKSDHHIRHIFGWN